MRLPRPLRGAFEVTRNAFRGFSDDEALLMAAGLSFYTIISLAPLTVLLLTVLGTMLEERTVQDEVIAQVESVVGGDGSEAIATVVREAEPPEMGSAAAIGGLLVLLFGATNVFARLQDALNRIWSVAPEKTEKLKRNVWLFVRTRLLSFAMVLTIAFLLLVSLFVSGMISAAISSLSHALPMPDGVYAATDFIVSFLVATLLFAAMYRILPDARIAWREVWIGAAITSGLFAMGKFAIGLYLGRSDISSAYGAAGSLVVLLIWVYYSSIIFLFGAELSQAHAEHKGIEIERVEPKMPRIARWIQSWKEHRQGSE